MSFLVPRSLGKTSQAGSELSSITSEDDKAQALLLRTLKELPKSRYATQLSITQMPVGRGRKVVFSHIEVYKMVETIANELRESGVRPGTVCAMVTPNSVEAVVYFLALQWIGAIAAPVDISLDESEMKCVLREVGAFTVVSPHLDEDEREDDPLYRKVHSACTDLNLIHWNIWRSTNSGVQLEQHGKRAGEGAAWKGGAADFVLDPSEISVHLQSPLDSEDTDSPLIVPLSHANVSSAAKAFASEYGLSPAGNTTVLTTSLHSIHGLAPLIATMYSGGHVIIPGSNGTLTADVFCALARDNKVTWVSGNAQFVENLRNELQRNPECLDGVSLAFVRCHDGRVPLESIKALEDSCRTRLLESYGTTETGGMVTTNTAGEFNAGTSGKPINGVQLAVFHPATREILPAGSSGDIGVVSDTNFSGYLNSDDATKESQVKVTNEDGTITTYVLTGRRGTVDKKGYLIVEGVSSELRRAEIEEEVRSQRALEALNELRKKEDEERLAREKEDEENELRRQKEEEEVAAERRRQEERDKSLATVDDSSEEVTDDESSSSSMEDEVDGTTFDRDVDHMRAGFTASANRDEDSEAMSKILEKLLTIEESQKKLVADMKASHALEVAELKRLLEETERANKLAIASSEATIAPSVIQVNMDEVNAAVNAATLAAQDSSRHTAEAAEAARRAAKLAEEAAAQNAGAGQDGFNPNASQVEIKDPMNIQKTITVSLDEIEHAMATHSAVAVCRAFGRPDPRYGNEVFCCILPMKGARVSEPWLKLHAQSVLPAACVPKKFYYREDLKPYTQRAELAADNGLKRISHISGYTSTKMVKDPSWGTNDPRRSAA